MSNRKAVGPLSLKKGDEFYLRRDQDSPHIFREILPKSYGDYSSFLVAENSETGKVSIVGSLFSVPEVYIETPPLTMKDLRPGDRFYLARNGSCVSEHIYRLVEPHYGLQIPISYLYIVDEGSPSYDLFGTNNCDFEVILVED